MDYQGIANEIGEMIRAAEQSAEDEGATSTRGHLALLHEQLGRAFNAVNDLGLNLDWNQVAGNPADGDATRSGGTGKNAPTNP